MEEDFYVPPGWISLSRAIAEIVKPVAGDHAWEQIKTNIAYKNLPARCFTGAVTRNLEPQWLDFVERVDVSNGVIFFYQNQAFGAGVTLPRHVSKIVVSLEGCVRLWLSGGRSASIGDLARGASSPVKIQAAEAVPALGDRLHTKLAEAPDPPASVEVEQSAGTATPKQQPYIGPLKKKRGPQPSERERVEREMQDHKSSLDELNAMKGALLAFTFKTNISTARRALENLNKKPEQT